MLAALLTSHDAPLELAEVEPCELAPGQVLIKILTAGICGKQLAEIRGDADENAPTPRLLGHEGCGIVKAVGPGVTKVKEGDKTILHWRKSSGMDSAFPRYRYAGREITSGRITTFSEEAIISENRLTKVPLDTPNELCALLGCALSTAIATLENEAKLKMGESVLIVGCGGVGLNLIRVAKMMGASLIVGLDRQFKGKSPAQSGVDFYCESATDVGEIREGYDVVVDTTGNVDAIELSMLRLTPSGRMIMVGQPMAKDDLILVGARHLFDGEGKTIKATQGGGFDPDRDLSRYVAMWRSGFLKLDGIVTHRFPLSEINDALDVARSGIAGRIMIQP